MKQIHHVPDIDAEPAAGLAGADRSRRPHGLVVHQRDTARGHRCAAAVDVRRGLQSSHGDHRAGRPAEGELAVPLGHDNWNDNEFELRTARPRRRPDPAPFLAALTVELDDDSYGVYNFNWGYYLESLRLLVTTGTGKPFVPGGS